MTLPREKHEMGMERYQRFEPIGRNCEFGFVLRNLGSEKSSLFRWTYIEPRGLINLLNRRFSGFFDRQNLIPTGVCNTIRETKFNCVFHSAIGLSSGASFDFEEPKLKMLYRIEKAKIDKQIADFTSRLEAGATICVASVKRDELAIAPDLLQALDAYAGNAKNSLLIVSERAGEHEQPGTIEAFGPRLLRGRLSRLAPGEAAYKVEFGEWRLIVEQAIGMLSTGDQ